MTLDELTEDQFMQLLLSKGDEKWWLSSLVDGFLSTEMQSEWLVRNKHWITPMLTFSNIGNYDGNKTVIIARTIYLRITAAAVEQLQ